MADYVLVTESGSDIHADTARRHGIVVVPMHVSFGNLSRDDDSFPPEELYESYRATGKLPQTSGCSPQDFIDAFDRRSSTWPIPPPRPSRTAAPTSLRRDATTSP